MSRSVQYRRDISDDCNWHQDQALNSTIYIVYQTGPTGFLLKEENETKNFKVFLGSVHNCTCSVFKKEKDLCKHICWVLLKKFRVPRSDPLSWQLGLNEREINQILRGDTAQTSNSSKTIVKKTAAQNEAAVNASNEIEQRPISFSDVCPICQDELLVKKLPVTYCRFGCGNNVHIKCMKVWADHQKSNGEAQLKCPLCRETFCSYELLEKEFRNNGLFKLEKPDLHYGITCTSCHSTPINGKCYKCTTCKEFYMCQACFNTDTHTKHAFVFREKINQKYRKATRDHVGMLPTAIVQSLATRELNEQDYDLLLQLDQANNQSTLSQIPEKVIKAWPCERVKENSKLLDPGIQCRICLRAYQPSQIVRKLPNCKHKFHADCIDNWLLHSHPTCPIDGQVVWDPVAAQQEKENKKLAKESNETSNNKKQESENKKQSKSSVGPSLDFIVNNKTYNNLVAIGRTAPEVPTNESSMNRNESAPIGVKHNFQSIKRTLSSDLTAKKASNVSNFQVEGRKLNQNGTTIDPMDDLSEFTNSLLMAYNLHHEPLPNSSKSNTQMTKSNQMIRFNRRTNELSTTNNKRNTNNNIDVFDISALIQDKPYQLSKFPKANQRREQAAPMQFSQLNQMSNLENINLAELVANMDLDEEEPETHLNKSHTTNMSSSNTHTLISTNNLTFQLGPTNSSESNYQQLQMDNGKSSLINKKKLRKQRTLFKANQTSKKNEPTQQVLDADLTDLIHVNNLASSKLKSSDQI